MKYTIKQAYVISLFMLICVTTMCGCGQKKELSFETSYIIETDLDPEMRRMTYTETAEVINTGSDSTKTLYFHIYGNKFKGLRQVEDGDIAVLSVQDQNGNELQYQREQEGVLYCVELGQALEPGQSVELTFACEVLIPDLESMYGVSRDGDVQLPMFSLQLAMYDQGGWDIAPLPENGDGRYGAAADYNLTIRVPEAYLLACNGEERSTQTSDGIPTHTYRAETRRDIVVFACEDYVLLEQKPGALAGRRLFGFCHRVVPGCGWERGLSFLGVKGNLQ